MYPTVSCVRTVASQLESLFQKVVEHLCDELTDRSMYLRARPELRISPAPVPSSLSPDPSRREEAA